jgi:hypothetical protein
MLLHRTTLMELHYEPSTDIMSVIWPEIEESPAEQVEENLQLITLSIKTYYISRFLMDARQTRLVPDLLQLEAIYLRLFKALSEAGLQKFARVKSLTREREMISLEAIHNIHTSSRTKGYIKYQFLNADTVEEATKWLLEK